MIENNKKNIDDIHKYFVHKSKIFQLTVREEERKHKAKIRYIFLPLKSNIKIVGD